jgi:hypothetical protein
VKWRGKHQAWRALKAAQRRKAAAAAHRKARKLAWRKTEAAKAAAAAKNGGSRRKPAGVSGIENGINGAAALKMKAAKASFCESEKHQPKSEIREETRRLAA